MGMGMGVGVRLGMGFIVVMILARGFNKVARAADPDPLLDFCVSNMDASIPYPFNGLPCKSPTTVTVFDFKTSMLGRPGNTSNPLGLAVVAATGSTLGGLNTQGLSTVHIDLAKGGFVPPHVHPRASEVLYVLEGTELIGFVDGSNNLFNSVVRAGELFVLPRGLVHFQMNVGDCPAASISSLNSQNPGLSLVASALFGSIPGIPDLVLEKTFSLTAAQVEMIKKAFKP